VFIRQFPFGALCKNDAINFSIIRVRHTNIMWIEIYGLYLYDKLNGNVQNYAHRCTILNIPCVLTDTHNVGGQGNTTHYFNPETVYGMKDI
jgi:hypothetical protein